ncbi:MAG: hypothetical protein WC554_07755 [Clostridia bacterium]
MNLLEKLTVELLEEIERIGHLIRIHKSTPKDDPILAAMMFARDMAKDAIKNDDALAIIKFTRELKTYK